MSDKQIKVSENIHSLLSTNALLNKQTMKDYLESMALYFDRNGISPKVMEQSPILQITKVKDQLIAFIRHQEKTKLNPIMIDLEANIKLLSQYLGNDPITKEEVVNLTEKVENQNSDIQNIKAWTEPLKNGGEINVYLKKLSNNQRVFNETFKKKEENNISEKKGIVSLCQKMRVEFEEMGIMGKGTDSEKVVNKYIDLIINKCV